MNRTLALASLALALSSPLSATGFPVSASYRGQATDAAGAPISGRHAVEVAYYEGANRLMTERFEGVAFGEGRFQLELGRGAIDAASSFRNLQELSAHYPNLELAFRFDGVEQHPRVKLLPGGHSAQTRAILAGVASANDGTIHSKKYAARSAATAVEAKVLSPGAAGPSVWATVAPDFQQGAMEIPMDGPFLSRAVRDMPAADTTLQPFHDREINPPRHESLFDENGVRFGTGVPTKLDTLAASSLGPGVPSPAPELTFEGVPNIEGFYPPDTEGVVGPNHYLQVTNVKFSIFDKSGNQLAGFPKNTSDIFQGFPVGHSCRTDNDGDAIFLYDRHADRWVLSQFSLPSGDEKVCFAVSTTNDPTGTYNLYSLSTQRFPDYFKLGTWPDSANNAWFMGTNSGFQNQYDVYAIDRANILAGLAARPAQFFQNYYNLMMPADAEDMPPAGSPGLLYTFRDQGQSYFNNPPHDSIDVFAYHVDWNTPANSTLTQINVIDDDTGGLASFNWSICGFFVSDCLNQPGTTITLDSGSWWPMKRLVYRSFGDHETLVGSWTVDVTGTPDLAGIRWFELRRTTPGPNWSIFQQGTFTNGESGATASHRWMPSIAMDGDGGIAVGYTVMHEGAPADIYASIRYAVRTKDDAAGTLRSEASMQVGTGYQTGSAHRWGDYSSMTVDPTDDCTFWYTSEYLVTNGGAPWQTRIGKFKIPGCGGLATSPAAQQVCTTSTTQVQYDVTLLAPTFVGTTNLTYEDCPAGGTCSFSDNPVVNPDDDSVFTISGLNLVAAGSHVVGIIATDNANPTITRDQAVQVNVFTGVAATPTLSAPANGAIDVDLRPTLSWSAPAQATNYDLQVATDAAFANVVYSQSDVLGTSHQLGSALDPVTVYYWRVRAGNLCGDSSYSSGFSFTTRPIPPTLLVDDDNNSPDITPLIGALLTGAGEPYDVWTTGGTDDNEPTAADLAPYKRVIWYSGDLFGTANAGPAGPGEPAEAALTTWLNTNTGNCFVLDSQDYLWDNAVDTFTSNMLGLSIENDDESNVTMLGKGFFSELGSLGLSYPASFSNYNDVLTPNASGIVAFNGSGGTSSGPAAIYRDNHVWKTAFFTSPIEAFPLASQQTLMNRILAYCDALFEHGFELNSTTGWVTGP